MTDAEKIKQLREMLGVMMDWARELPDEFLDGDPDTRKSFAGDMEAARTLIRAI